MDTFVENILKLEDVLLNTECYVCFNKFIDVKDNEYNKFYNNIVEKYKLNENEKIVFENNTTCMCFDDKITCLTCKNFVCIGCVMKMPDKKYGHRIDNFKTFINGYETYTIDDMEYTGIFTCPICKSENKI